MLKYQKQRQQEKGNHFISAALFIMSAVFFAYIVFKVDLTMLLFGKIKTQNPGIEKSITNDNATTTQTRPIENIQQQPQQEITREGSIFRYEDANSTIVMVNDINKVPERYRQNMKVISGSESKQTAVIVKDNQIYVPVTIAYQGRSVNVSLLLDTGATGVSVSQDIANRLGINPDNTRPGKSTLANGSTAIHYKTTADHISVGPKTKRNMELQIMPDHRNEETGLLGMSFLGDFPHMIDVKMQVVKWM